MKRTLLLTIMLAAVFNAAAGRAGSLYRRSGHAGTAPRQNFARQGFGPMAPFGSTRGLSTYYRYGLNITPAGRGPGSRPYHARPDDAGPGGHEHDYDRDGLRRNRALFYHFLQR